MTHFLIATALVLCCLCGDYARADTNAIPPQHTFPTVTSSDLNGKKVTLPRDFDATLNLCLIAFDRGQQKNIDTWTAGTKELVSTTGVSVYEIPTIKKMPGFIRGFITSGMRQGIAEEAVRAHTITLFIDKSPFRASLGLGTEKTIYAVLVNRTSEVLWSQEGDYTDAAKAELARAIAAAKSSPKP